MRWREWEEEDLKGDRRPGLEGAPKRWTNPAIREDREKGVGETGTVRD